jgi:voltage-gated potassium channel
MALIDLFAILPFYIPMFIPFDLRFLRILRVARMLRLFKLNRYSKALLIIGKVVKKKKAELIVTVFITFLLLLMASTMMFYLEHDVQPTAFPNIIASFWWAIATLTTVGYGDIYPVTGWGRLLSGVIALIGIGLVALPTGIISSGFMNEISSRKQKDENEDTPITYCPYCGKRIRDEES